MTSYYNCPAEAPQPGEFTTVTFDWNKEGIDGYLPNLSGTGPMTVTILASYGLSGMVRATPLGWSTNPAATEPQYVQGDVLTDVEGDITLYAVWPLDVTLSFDENGGDGTLPASQTGAPPFTTTIPAAPGLSRPGYSLIGWAIADVSEVPDYVEGDEITLSVNTTLFAVWLRHIRVEYADNEYTGCQGTFVEGPPPLTLRLCDELLPYANTDYGLFRSLQYSATGTPTGGHPKQTINYSIVGYLHGDVVTFHEDTVLSGVTTIQYPSGGGDKEIWIQYYANGGDITEDMPVYQYKRWTYTDVGPFEYALSEGQPVREGYVFAGWQADRAYELDNGQILFDEGEIVQPGQVFSGVYGSGHSSYYTIVLSAVWAEPVTVTVSTASGIEIFRHVGFAGQTIVLPETPEGGTQTAPVLAGYTADGTLQGIVGGPNSTYTLGDESVDLVSIWASDSLRAVLFSSTFKDGSYAGVYQLSASNGNVRIATGIFNPPSGHTLRGYNKDPESSDRQFREGDLVRAAQIEIPYGVLYAIWV